VNTKDYLGETPLHRASDLGHSQVVRELLDHGADIDSKDNIHSTPLHFAAMEGHVAVVNELLSPNDSNGATSTILDKRKSGGANVDAKNMFGVTPLQRASRRNHLNSYRSFVRNTELWVIADSDIDCVV
jgi:ankyrin repeat protein